MRISRVKIKNFRSIQELDIELPQVCALVGPNNVGKTNILEAIKRVLDRSWVRADDFSTDDIYLHDENRDIEIACTLDPPLEYVKFKNSDPVPIHTLSFKFTRYKVGQNKGEPRLEQQCLTAEGKPPLVLTKAPKKGEKHAYEPLVGIPGDVRAQIPLIYIGTNRSLRDQLPGARFSLLRQMFEGINANLHDPAQTIKVKKADGTEAAVPRLARFGELMAQAMELLRTEQFNTVERSIKRNVLRQLGFDPDADGDKLDLYFTPMDTFDFYKSLDLLVHDQRTGNGRRNAERHRVGHTACV
jgi:putative ATP-dependent endonuclease of the OLD family